MAKKLSKKLDAIGEKLDAYAEEASDEGRGKTSLALFTLAGSVFKLAERSEKEEQKEGA